MLTSIHWTQTASGNRTINPVSLDRHKPGKLSMNVSNNLQIGQLKLHEERGNGMRIKRQYFGYEGAISHQKKPSCGQMKAGLNLRTESCQL